MNVYKLMHASAHHLVYAACLSIGVIVNAVYHWLVLTVATWNLIPSVPFRCSLALSK